PSPQSLQERFGLLKVTRTKALGEPAVDRGQQLVRLGPFALLLPQPCEAHGGTEFPGLGLLAAGNVETLLEAGFRRCLWCPRLLQEQDAPEASDFRFTPAIFMLLHQG